jgi:hypothetical protein
MGSKVTGHHAQEERGLAPASFPSVLTGCGAQRPVWWGKSVGGVAILEVEIEVPEKRVQWHFPIKYVSAQWVRNLKDALLTSHSDCHGEGALGVIFLCPSQSTPPTPKKPVTDDSLVPGNIPLSSQESTLCEWKEAGD